MLLLLAMLGLCLLQLIPLPPMLLRLLSPPAGEIRDFALVPLGLERWRPISLEPAATWREVAKHVAYACVLFVVLQLGRSSRARRRMALALVLIGGAVAFIGLAHRILGVETLFGIYRYTGTLSLVSTIGNGNHLAAFLALTGTVGVGVVVSTADRQRAAALGVLVLGIGVAVVLTLSRGGIGCFVAALLALGIAIVARRAAGWWAVAPAALAAGALGVAVYLVADQLFERASTVDSVEKVQHQTKIDLWPMFGEGAAAFARTGMGRGAFEVAFTRYQTRQLGETFTHPENIVLQGVSELGLAAAAGLMALSLVLVLRLLRYWRLEVLELGALIALAGALLHDVFDFSLEMPATAMGAVVAAGIAFSVESSRSLQLRPSRVGVGLAAALLCLVAGAIGSRPSLMTDEAELRALTERKLPPDELRGDVMALIDRHPADYLMYSVMASAAAARNAPLESLAWVNRVLFLRPNDAAAHTAAAFALVRLGHSSQALGELKLAFEHDDMSALPLAVQIAKTADDLDSLCGDRADLVIAVSKQLRSVKRLEDADALVARHLATANSWQLLEHAAEVAASKGDHASAVGLLQQAVHQAPDVPVLAVSLANELVATGHLDDGLTLLGKGTVHWPQNIEVGLALAHLELQSGRPVKSREVLTRMMPFAPDTHARATLFVNEGLAHEAEGHPSLALRAWKTAAQLEPNVAEHYFRLATAQEKLGRAEDAYAAGKRALSLSPPAVAESQRAWLAGLEQAAEAARLKGPPDLP
jgi:tetratricopeptide (TPR) repeat protein